jgi:hypothetical protein
LHKRFESVLAAKLASVYRVDENEGARRFDRGVPDSDCEGLEQRVPELNEQERSDAFNGESAECSLSSSFFFFLEATVSL